jgi:hypothetical protein
MASRADADRMREIVRRLRAAGVEVLELSGCYSRGRDWARVPRGIIDHHDASTRKSGEWGALGVIRDGRPDVSGPLAQFQIGRCLDGRPRVAVVAAGRGNHAGLGGPLLGVPRNSGNSYLYGAECANDGVGEPYTEAAHRAHDVLFRVVADVCGWGPANVVGHREWAPGRKSDPRYDMGWRRARVGAVSLTAGAAVGVSTPQPVGRPLLRQGATGGAVREVQDLLRRHGASLVLDGDFGPATAAAVREFQRRAGLAADGVVGPNTWARLAAVPAPAGGSTLRQGSSGSAVRQVQEFLRRVFPSYAGRLVVDGDFGPATAAAVREFQRRTGLDDDGVIGPATRAKLAAHGLR